MVKIAMHKKSKEVVKVCFFDTIFNECLVKIYSGCSDTYYTVLKDTFETHFIILPI